MSCGFCYAPRGTSSILSLEELREIVIQLAKFSFKKINFAGGEPLLCSELPELIKLAKDFGMTTSIVTNGSLITEKWLDRATDYLDWIGVSIDSINHDTNIRHGRYFDNLRMDLNYYLGIINMIKKYCVKLKINTVVTSYNKNERMYKLILKTRPIKWKIFQILKIDNCNGEYIDEYLVTKKEFNCFINNHIDLKNVTSIITENDYYMVGSYVMIDPSGRFYNNLNYTYTYSDQILKVGIKKALSQMTYDEEKYFKRKTSL